MLEKGQEGTQGTKMRLSEDGLELIKRHEGLRLKAYRCPAGMWTIGYGHTKGVKRGMVIANVHAERFLEEDVQDAEEAVNRLVEVPMTQGQFDALVSFVFNLGIGAFSRSTLRKRLNDGDFCAAAEQFGRWVYGSQGKQKVKLPGLVARREDERALFVDGLTT